MSTFSITAHSFRKIPTPLEASGISTYSCIVPVDAIPNDFQRWKDVNARDSTLNGRVPADIRETLTEAPDWFVAYNRGLALFAESVSYDNQEHIIHLAFTDKNMHGVFDGGHTLAVILDERSNSTRSDESNVGEAFCKIEIMTGVPATEITAIVGARNTSKQVATKSLLQLDKKFNHLKTALGPTITNLVSWRENEDAPVDVREIIALMTALDRKHYDDTIHPIIAYSGKEACLKHFENNTGCYEKVYPLMKDVVKFWELIQSKIPDQYNGTYNGKFGQLTGCSPLKKPRELPITGLLLEYSFPSGYLYPIVGALRSMIVEQDGKYAWGKGVNPRHLVADGLVTKIFGGPIVNSIKDYRNPNKTGKDNNVWSLAYSIAENYFLRL